MWVVSKIVTAWLKIRFAVCVAAVWVLAYGANPVSELAANKMPQLHLPKVSVLTAGEGVSWMLRSSADNESQPAVFILSGPAGITFKRMAKDRYQLNWSTSASDVGTHVFTFLVEDASDRSISVQRTLSVDVVPAANVPPVQLITLASQQVAVEESLQFLVAAENQSGNDTLLYVDKLPGNAQFILQNDGSRVFSWQPGEADLGRHELTFMAIDAIDHSQSDSATVTIQVGEPIRAGADVDAGLKHESSNGNKPVEAVIEQLSARIIVAGQAMSQLVRASLPSEDFELVAARLPDGASFVSAVGREQVFRWRPRLDQLGMHEVLFEIRNLQSQKVIAKEGLHLTVRLDRVRGINQPPLLSVSGENSVTVGEEVSLDVTAVDPDGQQPLIMVGSAPARARFVDVGNGLHRFKWAPGNDDEGVHLLEFIARDRQAPENEVVQRVSIAVGAAKSAD